MTMDEFDNRRGIESAIMDGRCKVSELRHTWPSTARAIEHLGRILEYRGIRMEITHKDINEFDEGEYDEYKTLGENEDRVIIASFTRNGVTVKHSARAETDDEALRRLVDNHLLIQRRPADPSMCDDVVIIGRNTFDKVDRSPEERYSDFCEGVKEYSHQMELRTPQFRNSLKDLMDRNHLMIAIHPIRYKGDFEKTPCELFTLSYQTVVVDLITERVMKRDNCTVKEIGQDAAMMRGFRRSMEYMTGMPWIYRDGGIPMVERWDWDDHAGLKFTLVSKEERGS